MSKVAIVAGDLARALAVAVEAATDGGVLLRRELHRPGGPRGHGDHADVDEEIEHLIRARLLSAFPDWGYRGEETGSVGTDHAPSFLWLVDPNDGTRNFLEGSRGSSVSIALLYERQPVLGVVYSPCAPDDAGDFFVWAEGCGPPTRNGELIRPEPWPDELSAHSILLVSEDADRFSEGLLQAIAPARYRPMPSIAYRLALAAGGDATIGTSFKGAGDWDYAGGQALLRATGAELFDHDGAVTVYSPSGVSRSRGCFGGSGDAVAQILRRPWREIYARKMPPSGMPWFSRRAHLARGHAIDNPELLQRAHGCLLGQLAGDSIAGLGPSHLAHGGAWRTMAGQPTDGSELALALARTIVGADGYDRQAAAAAYGYWHRSDPFHRGPTTSTALRGIPASGLDAALRSPNRDTHAWLLAEAAEAAANPASIDDGALVRASPLGIWGHALPPQRLAEFARVDSRLTHPSSVSQEACAVYVVAIAHALSSGSSAQGVYEFARDWARVSSPSPDVVAAIDAAASPAPDGLANPGSALSGLHNAFYQLLNARSAEEGIVATAIAGGTGTSAAVAGALLGAVHGREAIPRAWRNLILSCRPLAGAPGVIRPRPASFWPVDALELAERLLLASS